MNATCVVAQPIVIAGAVASKSNCFTVFMMVS